MKRLAVLGIAFSVILSITYAGITLYDEYLSFGRMWETPVVKPHEEPLLVMAEGSVPVDGGEAAFRVGQGDRLEDPDPDRSMKRMFAGKTVYDRYCIHCHGKALDGQGTVGQSFSPLAQDLKSAPIQDQKDGLLFYAVSYGKNRMPALAATVSVHERWDVLVFLRAAAGGQVITGQ